MFRSLGLRIRMASGLLKATVDPDIEVDNDPQSVINGKDLQLERAIAEIMEKLKQPVKLPGRPAPPVKTLK